MNERIKELAGKALDKAVPYTWHNLDHIEVEKVMKEFAELIVKECRKVIADDMDVSPDETFSDALDHAQSIIGEHFGQRTFRS